MNNELKAYLLQKQEIIDKYLEKILSGFLPQRELIRAMHHSLMAGGKRLRPVLALASAQACLKVETPALPAACAIEMIHTYSLIHDDLPAMDDDDLRRGRPTCHKQFNEATAILAGDALLTHAFHVIAHPQGIFESYPDEATRLALITMVSEAAGVDGMVEGQMMDMQSYPEEIPDLLTHLKKIHALKTGKMISVSVKAGAISAGAGQKAVATLGRYAEKVGLAFQVMDDILNIEGNPDIMGKAKGSDALNDKMTFPGLIGLDKSKRFARTLIDESIASLSSFNTDAAAPLEMIARYIIDRDR